MIPIILLLTNNNIIANIGDAFTKVGWMHAFSTLVLIVPKLPWFEKLEWLAQYIIITLYMYIYMLP